jgi:EAL domain-containing protein (putative c-di-GMP-specific phosphodiesterase class I)
LIEQILEAKDLLNKFRDCNMNLAVDDFGTGYSSLSYLRQYPFTTVKIDGSFIQDLPHNQEAVSLVKTILAMAQALDLKTIAEGIETREQLEFLIQHGCDYGQGYLFSKPLPANEFRQFIIAFPNEIPRPMGDPGKI